MPRLLIAFFIFLSPQVFAFWASYGPVHETEQAARTYCEAAMNSDFETPPAWTTYFHPSTVGRGYYCRYFVSQSGSTPCNLPQIWDQTTRTCREPCNAGDIGFFTHSPTGYLVCYSGCAVQQTSDSSCTGPASQGGTCTARYSNTGDFCPGTSDDAGVTPADPGSHPDFPVPCIGNACDDDGGNPGGGDNGGGNNGGGDNGGGDNGGGDNGGNQPGTPNNGYGTADGGFSCDHEPVCDGRTNDQVTCELLLQQWLQRCPSTPLGDIHGDGVYEGDGEHALNIGDRLEQAKQAYRDKFDEVKSDIQSQLNLSVGGGGGGLPCNRQVIAGVSVELGICARADYFSLIAGLFYAVSTVLSAYIVLSRS